MTIVELVVFSVTFSSNTCLQSQYDTQIRIDVQRIGQLVILSRSEKLSTSFQSNAIAYGRNFKQRITESYSTLTAGHFQQVLTYRFGQHNCIVYCKVDCAIDVDTIENSTDCECYFEYYLTVILSTNPVELIWTLCASLLIPPLSSVHLGPSTESITGVFSRPYIHLADNEDCALPVGLSRQLIPMRFHNSDLYFVKYGSTRPFRVVQLATRQLGRNVRWNARAFFCGIKEMVCLEK
jgi:hypothetical protein